MSETQNAEEKPGVAIQKPESPDVQVQEARQRSKGDPRCDALHATRADYSITREEFAEPERLDSQLQDVVEFFTGVVIVAGNPMGDSLTEP